MKTEVIIVSRGIVCKNSYILGLVKNIISVCTCKKKPVFSTEKSIYTQQIGIGLSAFQNITTNISQHIEK